MAFTAKFSEFQLRNSLFVTSNSQSMFSSHNLSFSIVKPVFYARKISEQSFSETSKSSQKSRASPAPWLSKWPSGGSTIELVDRRVNEKVVESKSESRRVRTEAETRYVRKDKGQSAIDRIVLRLRNLGLGSDDEDENEEDDEGGGNGLEDKEEVPVTGDVKLGDLLQREWIRPDSILTEDDDDMVLPWEREEEKVLEEEGGRGPKRRVVKAPTLAELTIEDEELRRLRRIGMFVRERINVPKAGLTREVLEKIHGKWRKEELVRLKFHEVLAQDMKTAHEIVERRTRGLVIWKAGSVMLVYRGSNYEGPPKSEAVIREGDSLFIPDVTSVRTPMLRDDNSENSTLEKTKVDVRSMDHPKRMTEEEAEYNSLLDNLGPRFDEWWGTGVLPVDADLLPPKLPGYKTPFRLLPTGMRSRLTNAEMTDLRKLAKSLPCHFAIGRNRNHQGLAAAIVKLWEKSLVAKVAVKRGIQNTNNKIMAEELKNLTGGVLLLRNKYFIIIYRGKDFLPTSVASALAEREDLTKQIQDVEEKVRNKLVEPSSSHKDGQALAGTLAEFYEAQNRWGRDISAEERQKMIEEDIKAKGARVVKRIEHKLAVAQAKKLRAEKLLSKIEASMLPSGPDDDQETITDEERVMFRRVGLRMKAYLPLGIRGVFDGVIENMHLHWKHRELVKLISKQKTLAFVEDTARLLEYESGGILVAIERVPKGYALIYYRGKNYRRPVSVRPRNLLTKAKALKRSVAMQRHEALSQHITELEKNIEQMKKEIGIADSEDGTSYMNFQEDNSHESEFIDSEDEASSYMDSDDDDDDDEDIDWEYDKESDEVFS